MDQDRGDTEATVVKPPPPSSSKYVDACGPCRAILSYLGRCWLSMEDGNDFDTVTTELIYRVYLGLLFDSDTNSDSDNINVVFLVYLLNGCFRK